MTAKTTTTPLGDNSYASPYYSIGKQICQNLYFEASGDPNAKAEYYLIKIPGLRRFSPIESVNQGACRGIITTGARRTFAVFGTNFCEIYANGTRATLGQIASNTGVVQMAENGYQLILVDGVNGWIYDFVHNTFLKITDQYFPGNTQATKAPTHVCYLDCYFICNVPNTNEYYYSESYYQSHDDANDTSVDYDWTGAIVNGYWNPINSGKKIGKSDNISAIANCNNYLWLFGYNSNEVHYDTGDYNNQLFARYEGAILNYGCNAPNSVATYANSIFWLANDSSGTLAVFTNDGMQPKRISVIGIEQIIGEFKDSSDCIGYTYSQNSHSFYVMQFPSASRTFVYDMSTNRWHERTYLDANSGATFAWRGMFATRNFDTLIMGDIAHSGNYSLDPLYYQNDNLFDAEVNYIKCVKNTPILFSNGVNVRYNWMQVICNQGSGLRVNTTAGIGKDPSIQLAYSNDTGLTYNSERSAPIGEQGEYGMRTRILGGGMGRNRVFKITMTDPVPFVLVSLLINGEEMRF